MKQVLSRSSSLLALAALTLGTLAGTPAHAQLTPSPQTTGAEKLDDGIEKFNGYYGGTVYCTGWNYLLDIPDEGTRQAVLQYLVLNSYFPTGNSNDPKTLVPSTIADDPNLDVQSLYDLYADLNADIEIGDSIAILQYLSADVGAFTNVAVFDAKNVVYTPLLGEVRLPGFGGGQYAATGPGTPGVQPQPVSSWSGGTTYLWGSPAETFDAKITAICKDGQLIDCQSECNAHSGALASAEIGCEEVEAAENCCKLKYEYAWATGFKSVEVTGGGTGVKVTGYLGQSGGGSGTLLDCCD
jgi:hypothetical protein